ncbi:MAG: NUDIX hydrolase [Bacilli bacterium]|nr:NUDIX hydrolase [Bacilli bacterium]
MGYYQNKALIAKELCEKGLPWVKVYAVVRDNDEFIVLTKEKDGKIEYMLAGGGVDKGESLEKAIKREVKEELNMKIEVLGELGVYDNLYVPWTYNGVTYNVQYEIHVLDTKVLKIKKGRLGLKGEFDKNTNIARIDEKTLLNNVVEFNSFGIKLNNNQTKKAN